MELTKKRKSAYNIISGLAGQIITIALGIVIPRMFLVNYGSEVNGLISSVTQIYTYLALMEAGVGTATLQALYKPIALKDQKGICSIISATNVFYKRTGILYLIGVVLLSIFYPFFVTSEVSYGTVFAVVLMHGIPSVINFLVQGKFRIFLQAEGKQYILINLSTIVSVLISLSKIVFMYFGADIVIVQTGYLVFNLLQMLFIMIYMKRHYKWLKVNEKPNFEAIAQKNSVLVQQICDLVFRNTDVLILTIFCNLKVVSIYSVYTLFFSMISTLLDHISHGFSFALGQLFDVNRKRYIELRDTYETYRIALVFALYSIADVFILPFIKLYTAGVNDINYLDFWIPKLFIVTYLLSCGRANCAADINYAQHFKLTQSRCIIEAVINIVVSVVCVNIWGIYGVLIGTIVALLYRANDMIIYANRRILNRSPWATYKRFISNVLVFILISYITSLFKWNLDSYVSIILWAIISGIAILAVYFVVASVLNVDSFRVLKDYIVSFIKSKKVKNQKQV